jgi:hypothetical protein
MGEENFLPIGYFQFFRPWPFFLFRHDPVIIIHVLTLELGEPAGGEYGNYHCYKDGPVAI